MIARTNKDGARADVEFVNETLYVAEFQLLIDSCEWVHGTAWILFYWGSHYEIEISLLASLAP